MPKANKKDQIEKQIIIPCSIGDYITTIFGSEPMKVDGFTLNQGNIIICYQRKNGDYGEVSLEHVEKFFSKLTFVS